MGFKTQVFLLQQGNNNAIGSCIPRALWFALSLSFIVFSPLLPSRSLLLRFFRHINFHPNLTFSNFLWLITAKPFKFNVRSYISYYNQVLITIKERLRKINNNGTSSWRMVQTDAGDHTILSHCCSCHHHRMFPWGIPNFFSIFRVSNFFSRNYGVSNLVEFVIVVLISIFVTVSTLIWN